MDITWAATVIVTILMGLVVCFSGKIGSGKSSISRGLSKALRRPRVGFGDYLRTELQRRGGDPECRSELQDIGQSLVEQDPEGFSQSVLSLARFQPGGDLLVDGIRHLEILSIVQRLVWPSRVRLIYLCTDETMRFERLRSRSGGASDLAGADQHLVEAEIAPLQGVADAVFYTGDSVGDAIGRCRCVIAAWSRGAA